MHNTISRRQFLAATGAITGTALLNPLTGMEVGAANIMAPKASKKLRLAMVGTGIRGTTMWGRDLMKAYPDYIEFVGLCDKNEGRVETGKRMIGTSCPTYTDFEKMMQETKPDVLIVIDALAARSTRRLNRTIQITNTGIQPGSGVGNHRNALTQESLGVPVIAIGVPTVVDAATIVGDALEKLMGDDSEFDGLKYMGQHRLAFAELNNMYMTGKDIDAVIKRVSFTISEGINIALEKE